MLAKYLPVMVLAALAGASVLWALDRDVSWFVVLSFLVRPTVAAW